MKYSKMHKLCIVWIFLIIPALFISSSCSDSSSQDSSIITDMKWVLESYGDPNNPIGIISDTETTVEFSSVENRVKGSAGCNSYGATYILKGDQLSINSGIEVTEMYCLEPEGVMDQEREYLNLLTNAESYEVENAKLILYCDDEVLIYKDQSR